ncbi:MAG: head-tail connector protein [Clostridium sp.]|uniref:head-tail connector protein n=1 Tax=Clostridium sp. TaxID=1506 RepID=UPI003F3E7AE6
MITLEEMKKYMRVDFDEDDELINLLIEQAQIYIDECCGEDYKSDIKYIKLSNLLIKKIVSDTYENREMYINTKKTSYDRITESIFDILANKGDGIA